MGHPPPRIPDWKVGPDVEFGPDGEFGLNKCVDVV